MRMPLIERKISLETVPGCGKYQTKDPSIAELFLRLETHRLGLRQAARSWAVPLDLRAAAGSFEDSLKSGQPDTIVRNFQICPSSLQRSTNPAAGTS